VTVERTYFVSYARADQVPTGRLLDLLDLLDLLAPRLAIARGFAFRHWIDDRIEVGVPPWARLQLRRGLASARHLADAWWMRRDRALCPVCTVLARALFTLQVERGSPRPDRAPSARPAGLPGHLGRRARLHLGAGRRNPGRLGGGRHSTLAAWGAPRA